MTPEEYEMIMGNAQMVAQNNMSNQQTQQQLMFAEQERGLAEEQLDVEEIINRIYNLLQGKEQRINEQGATEWIEPKNNNMRILSEWGIQRIMQTVRFHINKNTLLSNFDMEQINRMMLHFTTELNDLVLLKYNELFREVTFEECKEIFQKKLNNKEKIKYFVLELLGKEPDKVQINKDLIKEFGSKIEEEIKKIKDNELHQRIKEYGLLLWEIEQSVYSTLNRALGGKERETLRRHASFSEVRALQPELQKKGGMFSWIKG